MWDSLCGVASAVSMRSGWSTWPGLTPRAWSDPFPLPGLHPLRGRAAVPAWGDLEGDTGEAPGAAGDGLPPEGPPDPPLPHPAQQPQVWGPPGPAPLSHCHHRGPRWAEAGGQLKQMGKEDSRRARLTCPAPPGRQLRHLVPALLFEVVAFHAPDGLRRLAPDHYHQLEGQKCQRLNEPPLHRQGL